MLNDKMYYEKILRLLVTNIILYVSDIAKILEKNLADFTETVGFSISAVSRIRKKVKESPESALENLPYALCMLTALDTIYLFKDIDIEDRKEIEKILLANLCEEITLFYDKDGNAVTTSSIEGQQWFRLDYKTGKGFIYQMQFFLYEINKMKEGKEFQLIENELLQKLQNAKVAFTVMGLKEYQNKFYDIKNSLETIYQNNYIKEHIYVSSLIESEIYKDNISEDLRPYVEECPDSKCFEEDEHVPHYVRDFAEIITHCLKEDSYLLLFIQDEEYIGRYLPILNKDYKGKIIFAYNRYFSNVGKFNMVFDYKNSLWVMKFNNAQSKYDNFLGGWGKSYDL